MVCVKSVKLPLDDFILQVKKRKVNRLTGNFTVCLQDLRKCRICLQTVQKNEISLSLTERRFCVIFSALIISMLNIKRKGAQ
jgi:recombinational DNA repair protein RecR